MAGRSSSSGGGHILALRDVGTYLGLIVFITRGTIKLVYGKGGKLEGWPVDVESAFSYSVYYADRQVNKIRRERRGDND